MTEVNLELENKLWSISVDNSLTSAHLEAVRYLVKRLESYLQVKLVLNTFQDELDEEGFCWTFRSDESNTLLKSFAASFNGIIGMAINYDENAPHYSASLFLFGSKSRLVSKDDKSYVELFYEKQPNGTGEWRSLGWQEDEFDEFEDVEEDTYGRRFDESSVI